MNIISFGDSNDVDFEPYKCLSQKTGGMFQFIELPQNIHSFKQAFENLIQTQYSPFNGTMACSHLRCNIQLYPNPVNTLVHSFSASVSFPSILSVVGFLPAIKIRSPATISRHMIFPSFNQDPALCIILNECLKVERMAALVMLANDWFALINSISEKDRSCLVLSIFAPGTIIPWMGPLSQLADVDKKNVFSVPKKTAYDPSYASNNNSRNNIPCIKDKTLQTDINKILDCAKNLPNREEKLYSRCEKLRQISEMYCFPALMDKLSSILESELCHYPFNSPQGAILTHLIDQIKKKEAPLQRTQNSESISTRSAMSLTNLLN